ncbi:DUF2933 domain-containing protein [Desmospora profundinema]|uniref:DUF2933 domain-containing protein n=1 Tax=Desmospora profundinema TaxID=1571184 RepID=A0ABU1IGY5_9BACL|nr:DUF2933 domain-containing protein [Desmospora profundinema]MDR6224033.1 hypothetical protein [Desmospora profundinema]
MEWLTILGLLACPLMMIFCMRGMFHKDSAQKGERVTKEQPEISPQELQSLQIRMGELMEQNHHLMKELESIKGARKSDSN